MPDKQEECYTTQSLSNSKAWKDFPEEARKAADKEVQKYVDMNAVVMNEVEDWRDVRKRNPKALVVMLAFVWVWKFTELSREFWVLAARLCALGDNLRDANNVVVTGIDIDEILYCMPPTLWQSRLFRALETIKGHLLGTSDWHCAYLTARLGGRKTWSRLPIEVESEEGNRIREAGGIPVHEVSAAVYGLQRAGQDYSKHSSIQLGDIGFRSARDLIQQSPSQYFRAYRASTGETVKDCVEKRGTPYRSPERRVAGERDTA